MKNEMTFLTASSSSHDSFLILESVRNARGEIYDFRFAFVNENAAKVLFTTPTQLQGKLLCEHMPINSTDGFFGKCKRVVETGQLLEEVFAMNADATDAYHFCYQVSKLYDGVAITTQNIALRKDFQKNLLRTNERLRESEAQLREVQQLARLGHWDIDLSTNTMQWSDEVFKIFDRELSLGPLSFLQISARIHPDDLERLQGSLAMVMNGDETQDLHCRVNGGDGVMRYIHSRARRHCDEQGIAKRLSGTLMDVSEKIRLHDALSASDIRFQAFMENNPAVAFIKDRQGKILYMNATGRKFWNFDAIEGKDRSDADLWSPELATEMRSSDAEVLNTGVPQSRIVSLPVSQGGLRTFLVNMFELPVPGYESLLGGVSIDLSEQQKAEQKALQALADKEVLLKEVHHRVKNNLQIISSLLGMQAGIVDGSEVAMALRESQDRVQSMAIIHELLYGLDSLQDIDFRSYAERLMGELLTSYGVHSDRIRGRIEVDFRRPGIDHAIPCGLILNELISNALKYAFPYGRCGEILVSLASGGVGRGLLLVADNGVGLPSGFSLDNGSSLGLRIVNTLVRQLKGSFDCASSNGSSFRITFPV